MNSGHIKKTVLFGIVSFVIFLLILQQISFEDLTNSFRAVKWQFSLLAFIFYIMANIVRAYRFNLILNKEIGIKIFLRIIFLQNFWGTLLPFRLGELSYIHMVNKNGINIGRNIASLIGARVLDLVSILAIFTITLTVIGSTSDITAILVWPIIILFVAVVVFGAIFIFLGKKIPDFFFLILKKTSFYKFQATQYILEKVKEITNGFFVFREKKILLKISLASLLIWILIYLCGLFLIRGVGINIGFWQMLFVYSFSILIGLVPVFIFNSVGIYEGVLIAGFMFFGINKKAAISMSFILHAQELIFVLILALIGFIGLKFCKKNDSK